MSKSSRNSGDNQRSNQNQRQNEDALAMHERDLFTHAGGNLIFRDQDFTLAFRARPVDLDALQETKESRVGAVRITRDRAAHRLRAARDALADETRHFKLTLVRSNREHAPMIQITQADAPAA